jgi:hypothetical protein
MTSVREYQAKAVQPLVITPSPFTGESLPGFILRTAERNGYSPMKLLHYAGMDDNEARSARPSLEKLAPLFGKSATELKAAGLDSQEAKHTGRHLQIMGHSIPSMFTRSKHASACLECVREYGYIDGFHELKYAVACPEHRIRTVRNCIACHKPLSWHREGLTKCSCGAEIIQTNPEKITNPAVLTLLGVLYAKLMRQPLNQAQMDKCGFPVEAMEQLSIQTLLSMIYRFGLFNGEQVADADADADADFMAVETTADALSNWPHCFHDYLSKVHAPNANLKVSGLRGQFNSFYESFFKNIDHDQELHFMRDAFVEFGQQHWQHASVHPKLSPDIAGQTMGMQQLATRLGVQPCTLRKMIEDKVINVEINELNATRKLVKLAEQQPFEFASGRRLSLKQAAQQLNVPLEVLRAYRSHGYYEAKHFAPMHMFHERDVEILRKRLMQGMQFKVPFLLGKHHITLDQVMRLKITSEMKVMWLNAVSKRQILAVGTVSSLPSGLVFNARGIKSYLENIRQALQNTLSLNEVQSELKIDRFTLFALVKHGLLEKAHLQRLGLRITENSFNHFNDSMIACSQVALLKNTTQKAVLALCKQMRIPVIQIASLNHLSRMTCWIPRFQLNLLGVYDGAQQLLAA